jgi:glycosyltransferase involved in cell wall biosynthesis
LGVLTPRNGGPYEAVIAMCLALRRVEPNVRLTIATTSCEMQPGDVETLRARLPADVALRVFPGVFRHSAAFAPSLFTWLASRARDIDAIHMHGAMNVIAAGVMFTAQLRCVRVIVRPLGALSSYAFEHRRAGAKAAYFSAIERRLLDRASAIHCTTEGEATDLARLGLAAPSVVVPLPVDVPDAPPVRRPAAVPTVLFIGRLDPVKRLGALVRGFAEMRRTVPNSRLVIAGPGDAERDRLISLANELGVSAAVSFPGFVNPTQRAELLSQAHVFALLSSHENFGVALVEAMTAGVPCVISRDIALAESLVRADAVIAVATDDARAVGAALSAAVNERVSSVRTGRALGYLREHFAPANVGRRLATLYLG